MALRIRIEHGQDAGKTLRLPAAGLYRAGRSPQCSFQVVDMKVSKEHFEIAHDPANGTTIRDLHSTHGTLLNGQKVDDARPLAAGDEIRVGLTVLRALSDGPSDTEVKPIAPLPPPGAPTNGGGGASAGAAAGSGGTPGSVSMTSGPSGTTSVPSGGGAKTVGTPVAKSLPPDALVGTTLAGYKILEKVGAGGMGSVYRSEQLSLHREVAIKVLNEKLVSDSAFVDQFVNEARAAGQLNHPNVVQVYDVGQADGRHFFSMEFIHGGSLEGKIPKAKESGKRGDAGGVPWQDALPWFLDAANALIFAEKKGILHRDIKPDNFMLGQDGSVKLCDLGLAKKSESADLLAQGIIGTPHFIAPEAIRRKTDVDLRADLYSLGCTFYRLLTGKNPYSAPSVKEILLSHLNAPVPRASAMVSDLPKELDEIIVKLMQKEPAERFQSAKELWEALDKVRLQFGLEAHGLHPGRAKKFAILGGVLAVVAIGVAVYFVTRPPEKGDTVYVPTPGEQRPDRTAEVRASDSKAAFFENENKAGGDKLAETWDKPIWREIETLHRKLNEDYPETEYGKKALERADDIKKAVADGLALRKSRDDAISAAKQKADGLAAAGLIDAKKEYDEGKAVEAEKKLDETIAAVKAAGKWPDGRPLLAPEEIAEVLKPLEALRRSIAEDFLKSWGTVSAEAELKSGAGTAEGLSAAIDAMEKWLKEHAAIDGNDLGEVAKAWNGSVRDATSRKADYVRRKETALLNDFLVDEKAAHIWIVSAYAPRGDENKTVASWFANLKFVEAAAAAEKASAAARTPDYREWFMKRAREARLVSVLPKALSDAFDRKPWKDKIAGGGWSGVLKDVKPEGVTSADGKLHAFPDEGLHFLVSLFADDKGVERVALDADGLEALGCLAEAAAITAPIEREEKSDAIAARAPALFDAAAAAWTKAGDADAARKDRLAQRALAVKAERDVKALFDESAKLNQEVLDWLAAIGEAQTKYGDLKVNQAAREKAKAEEASNKAKLATARTKLDDAEKGFSATLGRALLYEPGVPPANATYAGEKLPQSAPPPPAPPATPAPASPPAGPAMGNGSPPPEPKPPIPAAPGPTPPASGGAPMDGVGMAGGMDGGAMEDAQPPAPAIPAMGEPPAMDEPRRGVK